MGLSFSAAALVLALCLDAFVASFAFGAEGIRIPVLPAVIVSAIGTSALCFSLLLGGLLRPLLPEAACRAVGFSVLLLLGLARLMDSGIKNLIRRSNTGSARFRFRFLHFDCILRVYADSTAADSDHSQTLSCSEAAPLALALSADSLAAGFGAGVAQAGGAAAMAVFSFLSGLLLVGAGALLGRRFARRTGLSLSWLGGAVLILLGFSKLL